MKNPLRIFAAIMLVAVAGFPAAAFAQDLPKPSGDIVLVVSGILETTNDEKGALFDMAMLEALGPETISTTTIWTEGTQEFTGVSLKALLELVGVSEGMLRATAINDYAVEIPVADAVQDGPILAYMRNGELMTLRDKGPLWVVYPFDSRSDYRTEVIYSRSIWQLDRIEVIN